MANESKPLAQMNIKNCGVNGLQAIKEEKQVFLVRIFGEANEAKTKLNRANDPYTYLIGNFKAKNNKGERFHSDTLFLPATIQEKVEAELKSAGGNPVEFGYDIHTTPDTKSSVGYRYAATSIRKTAATDRLAAMEAELDGTPMPGEEQKPAEPAPAPAPPVAEPPAPVAAAAPAPPKKKP